MKKTYLDLKFLLDTVLKGGAADDENGAYKTDAGALPKPLDYVKQDSCNEHIGKEFKEFGLIKTDIYTSIIELLDTHYSEKWKKIRDDIFQKRNILLSYQNSKFKSLYREYLVAQDILNIFEKLEKSETKELEKIPLYNVLKIHENEIRSNLKGKIFEYTERYGEYFYNMDMNDAKKHDPKFKEHKTKIHCRLKMGVGDNTIWYGIPNFVFEGHPSLEKDLRDFCRWIINSSDMETKEEIKIPFTYTEFEVPNEGSKSIQTFKKGMNRFIEEINLYLTGDKSIKKIVRDLDKYQKILTMNKDDLEKQEEYKKFKSSDKNSKSTDEDDDEILDIFKKKIAKMKSKEESHIRDVRSFFNEETIHLEPTKLLCLFSKSKCFWEHICGSNLKIIEINFILLKDKEVRYVIGKHSKIQEPKQRKILFEKTHKGVKIHPTTEKVVIPDEGVGISFDFLFKSISE